MDVIFKSGFLLHAKLKSEVKSDGLLGYTISSIERCHLSHLTSHKYLL